MKRYFAYDLEPNVKAKYIIHTDVTVTNDDVQNATKYVLDHFNETKKTYNNPYRMFLVGMATYVNGSICQEASVCNLATTDCESNHGDITCTCKSGYEKPQGYNQSTYLCVGKLFAFFCLTRHVCIYSIARYLFVLYIILQDNK